MDFFLSDAASAEYIMNSSFFFKPPSLSFWVLFRTPCYYCMRKFFFFWLDGYFAFVWSYQLPLSVTSLARIWIRKEVEQVRMVLSAVE